MKAEDRMKIMNDFVESRDFAMDRESIRWWYKKKGIEEIIREIPREAWPTVHMLMNIACRDKSLDTDLYSCLRYRCMVYMAMDELNKGCKKGEEVYLIPSAWWTDGIWLDVPWIIKLTNGMLNWKGDLSCELCMGGPGEDCPFCLTKEEMKEMVFLADYVVSTG